MVTRREIRAWYRSQRKLLWAMYKEIRSALRNWRRDHIRKVRAIAKEGRIKLRDWYRQEKRKLREIYKEARARLEIPKEIPIEPAPKPPPPPRVEPLPEPPELPEPKPPTVAPPPPPKPTKVYLYNPDDGTFHSFAGYDRYMKVTRYVTHVNARTGYRWKPKDYEGTRFVVMK